MQPMKVARPPIRLSSLTRLRGSIGIVGCVPTARLRAEAAGSADMSMMTAATSATVTQTSSASP